MTNLIITFIYYIVTILVAALVKELIIIKENKQLDTVDFMKQLTTILFSRWDNFALSIFSGLLAAIILHNVDPNVFIEKTTGHDGIDGITNYGIVGMIVLFGEGIMEYIYKKFKS